MSDPSPMLTTVELAAHLRIGREAARKLMQNTRGVITLPPIHGNGKKQTRRMPLAVFEALLAQRSTHQGGPKCR
jgi:hypothetical protein